MAVPLTHGLDLKRPLLALLAQGEPRSGTWLARALDAEERDIETGVEQLRALENGLEIRVADALERPGPDVNTVEDFERVLALTTPRN